MISSATSLSLKTSSIKYLLKILILLDLLLVLKNCKSLPKLILVIVVLLSLLISLRVAQILSLTLLPALMSTIRHFLLIKHHLMFLPLLPILLSTGVLPPHPAPLSLYPPLPPVISALQTLFHLPLPNPVPSRSSPPSPNPAPSSSRPRRIPPTRSFSPSTSSFNRSSPHPNTRTAASKRPSFNSRTTSNRHSILILGDSNTKYIKLSGAYNIVREPTFLIQDINPALCKGFGRVWIHCGINNLKYNRCTSYSGVKEIFKLFMSKLGAIRNMCPDTKIYVSPILPCAIPGLNDRAGWFNSLLFSVKHIWWNELKINRFCYNEIGMLAQQFMSFRNRGDKIHLGMHGIRALECALLSELNKVNGRLYSSVVYNH